MKAQYTEKKNNTFQKNSIDKVNSKIKEKAHDNFFSPTKGIGGKYEGASNDNWYENVSLSGYLSLSSILQSTRNTVN